MTGSGNVIGVTAKDPLREYRRKRDPQGTPEPYPKPADEQAGDAAALRFVIQEHHARALHWDVRLERDGVLVSWAVPKGLPPDPKTNHLAKHTEDHPLDYGVVRGRHPDRELRRRSRHPVGHGHVRPGEVDRP